MLSPRVAQQMIGLGLLESIDEADLLSRADPDDADGDGISGRPNLVWSGPRAVAMGRFGWKAGQATIAEQAAAAMAGDIGIANPLAPIRPATARRRRALAWRPRPAPPRASRI